MANDKYCWTKKFVSFVFIHSKYTENCSTEKLDKKNLFILQCISICEFRFLFFNLFHSIDLFSFHRHFSYDWNDIFANTQQKTKKRGQQQQQKSRTLFTQVDPNNNNDDNIISDKLLSITLEQMRWIIKNIQRAHSSLCLFYFVVVVFLFVHSYFVFLLLLRVTLFRRIRCIVKPFKCLDKRSSKNNQTNGKKTYIQHSTQKTRFQ